MPLSNSEYQSIMRRYDQRQIKNRRQLEERRREIDAKIPQIREIEAQIARRSVESAIRRIGADGGEDTTLKRDLDALRKEKKGLLEAYGYPPDYLEMRYGCPYCRDTGYADSKKCRCLKRAELELLYDMSNIRALLARENFKTLKFSYYDDQEIIAELGCTNAAYMRRLVKVCREFAEDFDQKGGNLVFMGSTGVGKTFLSNCIAKELLDSYHTVIYLSASDLFDIFSKNRFDPDDPGEAKKQSEGILGCDLLIIDDLGTELNNSFTTSQLFVCVNSRINSRLSTIISTNLSLAALKEAYTERFTSRLMQHYKICPLYGEDIRLLRLKG